MPSAKFPSGLSSLDTGVHEHGGVVALAQQANLHALEINAVETALGAALANVLRYVSGAGKSTVVDGDFTSARRTGRSRCITTRRTARRTCRSGRTGAWVVIAGPLP
jgi:hypothetical protein